MSDTLLIVNPESGLGRTGRLLPQLRALADRYLGSHELRCTAAPRDAERLAREAAHAGKRRIVVAGGDGTVSEVVAGLLSSGRGEQVELALLPLGTGKDFARLLRLKGGLQARMARIESGERRRVDAARVRFAGPEGRSAERAFLNIVSFGMTGLAARWIEQQASSGRRGRTTYLQAGLHGIRHYRQPSVEIRVDGQRLHSGPMALAAVANGRYFGGGMKVAPEAQIDDGLLDIVIVPASGRLRLLARFSQLALGAHTRAPSVVSLRGKQVEIESQDEIWLEADGEPVGTLPASVQILPAAIQLCGL